MNDNGIMLYGKIQNGKKIYWKPTLHETTIARLEGKEFQEYIQQRFENVTDNQHGYYRALCRWLPNETEAFGGWTEEDVHEFFKDKFLSLIRDVMIYFPDGTKERREVRITQSTASIGKKRMAEFITKMVNYLAEHGMAVPEPEDFMLTKYSQKVRNAKSKSNTSKQKDQKTSD